MDSLVGTDWLAAALGAPDLVVLDASLAPPGRDGDPRADYERQHIPGARFLDLKALKAAARFEEALGALGVGHDARIVIYDQSPLRSATRGWWLLRQHGARQVAVLDGGLGKWLAEGRPVASGRVAASPARFSGERHAAAHVSKVDIVAGLPEPLVDARDAARFAGTSSDPRPGIADGHIPGARNLPFANLYHADGTFRSAEELRALFMDSGIDPARAFVASCGSGVTATSLLFAAHLLGNDDSRLYEGSWSEWGADPSTPKEVGPPRD